MKPSPMLERSVARCTGKAGDFMPVKNIRMSLTLLQRAYHIEWRQCPKIGNVKHELLFQGRLRCDRKS